MAKKPGKKLNLINLRVDDELLAKLKKLAGRANRPVANYVHTLVIDHVEAVERGEEEPKK